MRTRLFGHDNNEREVPQLNMASLPDLIFTVLFFFMIVTHMREVDLKVRYTVPEGTEIKKLEHKASIVDIYVGKPIDGDGDYRIQLNNQLATLDDIKDFVEQERASMNADDQAHMMVSIKADRDVPMGIITDIKQQLQQSFALRISYSATETNQPNQ